jgi:putative IMPACT (imprinted ancient) family translation regulator
MMTVPYNLFEQVKLLIEAHMGLVLDEAFAADVTITTLFTVEKFDNFQDALRELSHGRLAAEIIETNPQTIMPLGSFAGEGEEES